MRFPDIKKFLACGLIMSFLAASVSPSAANELQALIFGDSITQGFARDARGNWWGIETPPRGQRITWWGYGMHLEQMIRDGLHRECFVYNWGYGGLTSHKALVCGHDWDCIDGVLASRYADMILIMLGANDLYAGISNTATSFNLSVMLDKSLARGVKPVLGAITPNTRVPGYNDRIYRHYNPLIKEVARNKGVLWADHFTVMYAHWDRLYTSGDGLHLGDRGNHKLAETWFAAIKDALPARQWKTEIGLVNPSPSPLSGILRGFDAGGSEVWTEDVFLAGHGRRELDVTTAAGAAQAAQIRSMRMDIAAGEAVGYQKFYQAGRYRAGLEASPRPNQEGLFLPHIASNDQWWTGIGWTNTTSQTMNLQFVFDTGQTATRTLAAGGHDQFTIASLFDETRQPGIGAAQALGGAGGVGLMLFAGEVSPILSGVSLSDLTATELHFPHVARDDGWWTGLAVYNPGPETAELRLTYRDARGNRLGQDDAQAGPGQRMVGTPQSLNFPAGTAWFSVQSTQPVTGFALSGTTDSHQLAGYSVVGLAATSGVFPKLENSGWTGIVLVNIGENDAAVVLEAWDDAGNAVAEQGLILLPGEQVYEAPENLFSESIAGSTYVRFTSQEPVIGFQFNGSDDGTMLDAIPALGSEAHVADSSLYFPHIAAQ